MKDFSKKVVFLGSRIHVFEKLLNFESPQSIIIYALRGSYLENYLIKNNIAYKSFIMKEKNLVLEELYSLNFDILVSNGCPIIFPVGKFKKHQVLINIHPTYLPHLQGKTPMNGVFFLDYDFYGATMHYIDKGIDTGAIIYQQKEELTKDIDLGLLYFLALKLEGDVFEKGWKKLIENNFEYVGISQKGNSTYFNRASHMRCLDFKKESTSDLLKKIKSFGISTQGCITDIENYSYKIFEAEQITHKPLLEIYSKEITGSIVLSYDNKFLIKTIDGILKIKNFNKIS